jgi:general secretion pathway protein G
MKDEVYMSSKSAFTLLELLVVIMIISILSTVVGVKLIGRTDEAKVAAARAQIENFRTALKLYNMDNGVLPTQRQGLQALIQPSELDPQPRKFPQGGYLDRAKLPLDPWKHDYEYMIPGSNNEPYEIICYGRDGEPGGDGADADISSSDL